MAVISVARYGLDGSKSRKLSDVATQSFNVSYLVIAGGGGGGIGTLAAYR